MATAFSRTFLLAATLVIAFQFAAASLVENSALVSEIVVDNSASNADIHLQPVINPAYIQVLNADEKRTWTAGMNEFFSLLSMKQAADIVACSHTVKKTAPPDSAADADSVRGLFHHKLPSSFDARKTWPRCIHPIRNQMRCGSCWAFGATEAFSDRMCIATGGDINVVFSPEELVSCDHNDMGCKGGYLETAWEFLEKTGAVTDQCMPYTSDLGDVPLCRRSCADGTAAKRYFVRRGTIKEMASETSMMRAIMASGPIEASFTVYRDLFAYKSGVYRHKDETIAGGHAIKVVGWGEDEETGLNYWIIANSWGTGWGEDGYFRMVRGENEGFIESNGWAGLPDLDQLPNDSEKAAISKLGIHADA